MIKWRIIIKIFFEVNTKESFYCFHPLQSFDILLLRSLLFAIRIHMNQLRNKFWILSNFINIRSFNKYIINKRAIIIKSE